MEMQATANGRNPYFEGQHQAEDAEDTANRLALVAERDALRRALEIIAVGDAQNPQAAPAV